MLIFSTFNSDYLQNPALNYPHTPLLKSLFEKFTTEPIEIKYVNTNLIGELVGLKLENLQSCAILFRLFDFLESDSTMDEAKLEKHLSLLLKQVILIKQQSALPFLVFLCPSPEKIYNEELKKIEKIYIKKFNENRIHTLTLSVLKNSYNIIDFENPVEGETHIPYVPEFYTAMACLLARTLHVVKQKNFKLIAVDCDNTLWTGVAADDGPEGVIFKEHNILLQNYLVEQQARGKIICLCSKNEEQTVINVFNQREAEMPLKFEHLSKHNKINWQSKSKNIQELALELNLFPDSFHFIDDNPTEINDVSQIPGVFCITMPQNLEDYKNHWGFDIDEHLIATETDKKRNEFYKQAEIKVALATKFNDPIEYLRSPELGQSITISKIDSEEDIQTIERASQLSGKTNQFNTFPKGKGIEVNEIKVIVNSDTKAIFIGKIKDNFSPEDITAVAVSSLSKDSLIIDSFFLSCRVFCRGMEYEMLKHITQFALEKGMKNIKFNFKKSQKNKPASDFLNSLSEEINKKPITTFLLNKAKTYNWVYISLKFLLKKLNLYLDFSSLKVDDESILELSIQKLVSLNVDAVICNALNLSQQASKLQSNQLIINRNQTEITEKYLIELKQMTSSLKNLSDKFFIGGTNIKSVNKLNSRINTLCNRFLGEEEQDKSLVARGLDSLKATELRFALYESEKIIITMKMLLSEKTTNLTLANYIRQHEKPLEIVEKNNICYNQCLPVSFQQQRIWFAEQQESAGNSSNYHMTACYKLSENLDIQRFKTACSELIKLYDVFGVTFLVQRNELKQLILSPEDRKLTFKIKNLKKAACLEEAIQEEINVPWTMSSESLIRFIFFNDQVKKNYYIFFHVHHAIFDAISLNNCLNTISKLYQELAVDPVTSIAFPPQYSEFIQHQQKKLKDEVYQTAAFNFWQHKLSQIESATMLPTDQLLSAFKSANELVAKRYAFSLSTKEILVLKTLVKSTGVTFFSVINALFALLIASYTYQKNITIITASNGRDGHPSYNKMIGFFVNLLVQPFNLEGHQRFDEYLKHVHKNFLASQEFQDIAFDKIQEILLQQRIKDILLNPALIYQSYPIPELKLNEDIAELVFPKQPIIFDQRKTCRFGNFTLFAQEYQDKLNFVIEYAEDLFSLSFIEAFSKNFIHTITNVCSNPKQHLHQISVVNDEEQEHLINLSQGRQLKHTDNDNLVERFKFSLEKYPDNDALCYGDIRLSYKELDQKSTHLAQILIDSEVKEGNYVGIFLEANHLFFIAELAILKIGAIFIPLSKEDSNERLKSIVKDAKIKFFIVDDDLKGLFDDDLKNSHLISINLINNSTNLVNTLPSLITTMENIACIFYTSGSTGKPKGVIIKQKSIFRVVEAPNFLEINEKDKISQTANQAFDAAQFECWLAWNNGASLIVFDKNTFLDAIKFKEHLFYEKISIMWLTVALFHHYAYTFPSIFKHLKYLITGGDVVDKKAVECIRNDSNSMLKYIIQAYGPTEAGIFTSTCLINNEILKNYNKLPIGKPINNTEVYVLTPFNQLAPKGGVGVLYIGGDGIGDYLNQPLLNKSLFLQSNYSLNILYNSGDLIKWGMIKYQEQMLFEGRINTLQIKKQGFLIALPEIESALLQHPAIKQVAVLENSEKELITFFIKNEKFHKLEKKHLIHFLSKKLHSLMIPKYFHEVIVFPITRNGKLDKNKLLSLKLSDENNLSLDLSINENKLLKIFTDILNAKIGVSDNFFYFGGSSIQVVQIISEIQRIFNKRISFDVFRKNPTVQSLNQYLEIDQLPKGNLLTQLKAGSDTLSVIFIHPAGGGLFCFRKLIDTLDNIGFTNSCYGIEDSVTLDGKVKTLSIPQMAAQYLEYIQNEINNPFILIGYSFGGLVALEMAAQLESINKKNLGIILLDTWVVSSADNDTQQSLRSEVLNYCEEIIKQGCTNKKAENVESLITPLIDQCKFYQEIGFKFSPTELVSTPVYLLQAKELGKFLDIYKQSKSNYLDKFIKNLSIIPVEGDHFNLLENDSYLSCLADHISKIVCDVSLKKLQTNLNRLTFFSDVATDPVLVSSKLCFKV